MGYDDDGIFEIDQKFFQPCDCIQIQMVGRLIEQQDVRVAEQCARQQDFDLFAAV